MLAALASSTNPPIVADQAALRALALEAAKAGRVAVDLEASGMFTYRARLCTVQLAWDGRMAVVDALAAPVPVLADLLGSAGPWKIVHDVAFDARVLAEAGIELGKVHDTAIAAQMLGRSATGLASLVASELGVSAEGPGGDRPQTSAAGPAGDRPQTSAAGPAGDRPQTSPAGPAGDRPPTKKSMQQYDWRRRPFDAVMLAYLASDVLHLAALEQKLWTEVCARGIEAEVLEETRYRIACAVDAVRHPRQEPVYLRVKGVDRLSDRERAALFVLAELREREAERKDVPPHRVASADALLALARTRPRTRADVARVRGVDPSGSFAEELVAALAGAPESLPPEERARFDRPRPAPEVVKLRRGREARLLAWRRTEAQRRGVDEQVVLPGHCLKHAVGLDEGSAEELARVPGIGAFRVERDGAAISSAIRDDGTSAALPRRGQHQDGTSAAPPRRGQHQDATSAAPDQNEGTPSPAEDETSGVE